MNSDDALIDKTIQGDKEAFGLLVSKYQDRLFNTMFHIAGGTENAYDVVQETFLQAYLRLETFRRSSRFYTWIYRIAFNVAMGIKRKQKPVAVFSQAKSIGLDEIDSNQDSPGEQLIASENVELVQQSIRKLDQEFRIVIILREIEELSYEEISEILEIPLGTVRSRLHRGRALLKEILSRRL